MGARTPEELDELYVAAYRARDADAVAEMYEVDAVYAMSVGGFVVEGREAIRASVKATFDIIADPELSYDPPVRRVIADDWAFVHGTSRVAFTLDDGTRQETVSRVSSMLHRGEDGFWRFVVDHAST